MTIDLGIVLGSLSPAAGGLYESVRVPANKLAQLGERVDVYGLMDPQFSSAYSSWSGPSVHAYETIGPSRLGFSPRLIGELLAARHDIVHLHGLWMAISLAVDRWRRKSGRPTIISPRGMLDPWALKVSPVKKRLARLAFEDNNLSKASVLHALNEEEARAIRAFGLLNPIAIIPNGVDLPNLAPGSAPSSGPDLDERKILVFLGRLHEKKGVNELVDAWGKVVGASPRVARLWRLVIAGWGNPAFCHRLERQISERHLGGHVFCVGPLYDADKQAAFRSASAFILPSRSEGMPMAVLEAWSYQLPVFMTAECNLAQGFAKGAAFELHLDPQRLADTLLSLLEDTAALQNAGEAGRRLVEQRYTWDGIVADMRQLYAWVRGGLQKPGFII